MKHLVIFYFLFLFQGVLWAQDPEFFLDSRIPDGVCKTVFVSGDILYMGNGAAVDIYDITQPDTLILLGRLTTDGTVKKIFIKGGYAYIAETRLGIFIADISDPENAEVMGSYVHTVDGEPAGLAEDIFVSGSYAYIAYGDEGLIALDVTNPANPIEVGTILDDTQILTYAYAVDVKDEKAYVANGGYGMNVIDVSDPANMIQIGAYENSGVYPAFNDICVLNDIAYISADWIGLVTIDISDPANPSQMDSYCPGDLAISVFVLGNFAYLTEQPAYAAPDSTAGLTVIDVSDPWYLSGYDEYLTPGYPYSTFVKDTLIFIADQEQMEMLSMNTSKKLKIEEFENTRIRLLQEAEIKQVRGYSTKQYGQLPYENRQVSYIKSKEAFGEMYDFKEVLDENSVNMCNFSATSRGLIIEDEMGNISGFPVNGEFNSKGSSLFISQIGNQKLLYAVTDQEIAVFDITDFDNITRINTLAHSKFAEIEADVKNDMIAHSESLEFWVVHLEDPTDPDPPSGTATTLEPASGLCFDGDYLYVVEESMLEIFNVLDIDSILKESSTPIVDFPNFLSAVDVSYPWLAYVTETGYMGLVDITDPQNPQKLHEEKVSDAASDVIFLRDRNYTAVAKESGGLSIYKMGLNIFTETSSFETGNIALRLFVMLQKITLFRDQDTVTYIYLADNEDGAYTYKSSSHTEINEKPGLSTNGGLSQNHPNPFYYNTSINYSIPSSAPVELTVFDMMGQEIKTLINRYQKSGNHTVTWDGTDNNGNKVCSGIYFCTLKASGRLINSRKMLMIK